MFTLSIAAESPAPASLDELPAFIIPLFVVGFAGLWVFAGFMVAQMGGWADLARVYRDDGTFRGRKWRFKSGSLGRLGGYGNCLTIGGNQDGLYLAVLLPFRVGHPPLFIPWPEITVSRKTRKFLFVTHSWTEFTFSRVPDVPLRITEGLARRILNGLGRSDDGERGW